MSKLLVKNFSTFKGVDYSVSDMARPPDIASDVLNVDSAPGGGPIQRAGTQFIAGGLEPSDVNPLYSGLMKFYAVNTSGESTETLLTLRDENVNKGLYKIVEGDLSISYTGSDALTLQISYSEDDEVFQGILRVNETAVVTENLRTGLDENGIKTNLTDFTTNLDAISGVSISGLPSVDISAAFIQHIPETHIPSGESLILKYYYLEAVPYGSTSTPYTRNVPTNNKFLPSYVNLNGVLYFSAPKTNTTNLELHKYDGVSYYRAGIPIGGDVLGVRDSEGLAPTTSEVGSGSGHSVGQTYYFKYSYAYKDALGNYIEGDLSPASAQESVSGTTNLNVVVRNIDADSGFNTHCAIVNGAQTTTNTITVDSGHTLKVGDTAYFYDSVEADYVEREVTAIAATTITVGGAAVTVADNAVISANLRIVIYRTANGGTATGTYFFLGEIPNDSIGAATQTYVDSIAEGSEGAAYILPIVAHKLPPAPKYLAKVNNLMVVAGMEDDKNAIEWSDVDSPEYFDNSVNQAIIETNSGVRITAISNLYSELFIFKDRAVSVLAGDLPSLSFKVVELPTSGIGCLSNASLKQVDNRLFFMSHRGIYNVGSDGISEIGEQINTELLKPSNEFDLEYSVAVRWDDNDKYLVSVSPITANGDLSEIANSAHRIYVYDFLKQAWSVYNGVNFFWGADTLYGNLFFNMARLDTSENLKTTLIGKFHTQQASACYNDHNNPISFKLSTGWESVNEPSVNKRFMRMRTFRNPVDVADDPESIYTLSCLQEFNFLPNTESDSFNIDYSVDGWGETLWGDGEWGDSVPEQIVSKLKSAKARSMRLIFTNNNYHESPLISSYEIEISVDYDLKLAK